MTARRVRLWALAILAVISLASPLLEVVFTGRTEEFGTWALVETLLSLAPIFCWYHVDKEARGYRAGPLMNAGVVALAPIALAVYFVRSRGWRRGGISIVKGIVVLGAVELLGWLGEWIGKTMVS